MQDGRIPVTVITGYLGAGKTTLVNHLLSQSDRKLAVIVNEFGEAGLDGDLIDSGTEELIEISSGCICCVVRGDLIRTLRRLLDRGRALDGIVIETTGLANPSPVIQTFSADQTLAAQCRLDAVVTVVDALHIDRQLDDSQDAADQIALASVILLNKSDEAPQIDRTVARLAGINRFAPLHRINRGRAGLDLLLDTGGFELEHVADRLAQDTPAHAPNDAPGHDHTGGIGSVTLTDDRPLDADALERWLTELLTLKGERILRTKGILWVAGAPRRLVVQAVHMLLEGDMTTPWDGPPPHVSRLVFIGRDLDPAALRAGFLACRASNSV
ncbi:hypothetical protein LCGC14_2412240 [marine sediment metagenome]|uniref:CobW C-terminal domain-containing protein n=1 Tax=marine sediment metagenome TaxID=412755 RepID=A0A0F9CEC7_9ZZZZ